MISRISVYPALSDPAYRFESKDQTTNGPEDARYAAHGSRAADSTRRLRIPFRIRIPFADLAPRAVPTRSRSGRSGVERRCRWDLGRTWVRCSGRSGARVRARCGGGRGAVGRGATWRKLKLATNRYLPRAHWPTRTRRFTQTTTAAILSHLLIADATSVGAREPSVKIASKLRAGHVSII